MKKGFPFHLLIFFCFVTTAANIAQVNTEKLRRNYAREGFHTSISTDLTLKTGNTEYIDIGLGLRFDYAVPGNWHAFSVASYEFKEGRDGKINNEGFIHFRLVKKIFSIYYGEAFYQKQFDNFRSLEDRQLLGGGLRFHLVDETFGSDSASSMLDIFLGLGVMYEKEITKYIGEESEKGLTRSTNYLSILLSIDERAGLSIVSYFQPDFDNFDDYRSLTQLTLSFKVSALFTWTNAVRYFYDSDPPPEVLETDFELKSGFILQF